MVAVNSSVLVVVDMQNGFVKPASAHVVPPVVDLVRRWQAAGGDIVFTRFLNSPGSQYERLINWTSVGTAPETDIIDELAAYASRAVAVIDKPAYTPFTAEGEALFAERGWTDVVICGLTIESCVCKTAVDVFERGLTPWVVLDATGTHAGEHVYEAGRIVIRRFIGAGQLVTAADLDLPSPVAC